MGFPSTSTTDLDTAWNIVRNRAAQLRQSSQALNVQASQNTGADRIVGYLGSLADARDAISAAAATPGLAAYAQAQINNNTFDLVSAFNTMVAQIDATRAWIKTNFPKDGSGNLLYQQLDANGRIVTLQFTSAQLAGLQSVLVALVATID